LAHARNAAGHSVAHAIRDNARNAAPTGPFRNRYDTEQPRKVLWTRALSIGIRRSAIHDGMSAGCSRSSFVRAKSLTKDSKIAIERSTIKVAAMRKSTGKTSLRTRPHSPENPG